MSEGSASKATLCRAVGLFSTLGLEKGYGLPLKHRLPQSLPIETCGPLKATVSRLGSFRCSWESSEIPSREERYQDLLLRLQGRPR